MPGTGTIINVAAIIAGGFFGMLFGKNLSEFGWGCLSCDIIIAHFCELVNRFFQKTEKYLKKLLTHTAWCCMISKRLRGRSLR